MNSANHMPRARSIPYRWLTWCMFPTVLAHWTFFRTIAERASLDDRLSHVLVLPVVFLILLWMDLDARAERPGLGPLWQAALTGIGFSAGFWGHAAFAGPSGAVLQFGVIVLTLYVGFAYCYGWRAAWSVTFAFVVLAMAAPPPDWLLAELEMKLQHYSADVAELLFPVIGISYIRTGMVFSLPGLDIEVARECSGIRSAIAIQAAVFVGCRVVLQNTVGRVVLCLSAIPIAIFKNAMRISTLGSLGVLVSPDVLLGPLHLYGGPVFTLVAGILFVPIVLLFRRWDPQQQSRDL